MQAVGILERVEETALVYIKRSSTLLMLSMFESIPNHGDHTSSFFIVIIS